MNQNDFINLSEFLLGLPLEPPLVPVAITDLDPDLANVYLSVLTQWSPQASSLDQLASTWEGIQKLPANQQAAAVTSQIMNDPNNPNLGVLARQIILAWYTGFHSWFSGPTPIFPTPTPDPANYEQTLVWLLAQAHPMGVPLSFGYWQYPPNGAT
jgi:hypothetical protein